MQRRLSLSGLGCIASVVTDADGKEIPSVRAFWFAWFAFYPDTEIFEVGSDED